MKRHFELYPIQKPPQVFTMPSRKMIKTLKACLQLEIRYPGRPYGPGDIKGSLSGLYRRGFLDININSGNELKPSSWYVTTNGLLFLLSISDKPTVPNESILLRNIYKLKQNVMNFHTSMYNLKLTSDHITIK